MTNEDAAHIHDDTHDHHEDGMGHALPLWLLVGVWLALSFLTWVTAETSYIPFGGNLDMVVAMFIATVKASMVGLIFMHLAFDKPLNAVFFLAAVIFVYLFVSFAMIDKSQYEPSIEKFDRQRTPVDMTQLD